MTNSVNIAFDLVPTQPDQPLAVSVAIDGKPAWHTTALTDRQSVVVCVDDDAEGTHTLTWTLSGKTDQHTTLDADGRIVNDSMISIENLRMDEIDISNLLSKFCVYRHDFNGHAELSEHEFFGHMGCNGSVEMTFTSPLYLWLLDNM